MSIFFDQWMGACGITPYPDTGDMRDAYWSGRSTLLAYKFEPRLEGVVRFDYIFNRKNGGGLLTYSSLDDHNGIGPALTLGMNYAFNLGSIFKLEYRYDWATRPIFFDTKSKGTSKCNQSLSTAVVVGL